MPAPQTPSAPVPPGDVALFIDWENFKYSLYEVSRLPNIAALMQAVGERFGRPVIARAYADWQDYYHRKSWDQMNLYHAGIEPIYVPTRRSPFGQDRIKNSVDVKMSLDCLEVSFTDLHVKTFVLVAGDADFLHVASALRRRGARVIMVGVSGSTSHRLESVVDEIVFYDEEIDRVEKHEEAKHEEPLEAPNGMAPVESPAASTFDSRVIRPVPPKEISLEEAQILLIRLIRDQRALEGGRNYPPVLSWLSLQMRERAPRFHLEKLGFDRFKDFVAQMQAQEMVLVEVQGLVERVWLPEDSDLVRKPPSVAPAIAAALAEPDDIPAEMRDDFADIVLTADDIESSYRDYMAKGLLARFLYNKGHWDPADLPPQAAPPRSSAWTYRELPEIHKIIEDALELGVLLRNTYVDPYNGNEIPTLELSSDHPFVRKTFAEEQAHR